MLQHLSTQINEYLGRISLPDFRITDAIEILLLAFCVYHLILWMKTTKSWKLMKGIGFIVLFVAVSWILQLNTILWLLKRLAGVLAIAAVVVFQPEIRRALEKLGEKTLFGRLFRANTASTGGRYGVSARTLTEVCRAAFDMAEVKTGALLVFECANNLDEYIKSGILLNSDVSRQLLINIFEHNTPLHDGAVVLQGNKITAATCYLPLSSSRELPKNLGTRHRAALGLSEITDSLTIVVSEESGEVSYAFEGELVNHVRFEDLESKLLSVFQADQELLEGLSAGKEKGTK